MVFRYRFEPFGTGFKPRSGLRPEAQAAAGDLHENELVVDVGGACWESTGAHRGVLDHHFLLKGTNRQPFPSAAAAVLHQASLIAGAYKDRFETVWLVTHKEPDFDALCAMFLARGVIEGKVPAGNWTAFGLKPDCWEPGFGVIDWFRPGLPAPPEYRWPIMMAAYAVAVDNCRRIRCPRDRSLHSILYTARERRGRAYLETDGAHDFFREVADILASSKVGLNPLNDSILEDSPNFVLERRLLDQEEDAYRRDLCRARRVVVFIQQSANAFRDWFRALQATPLLRQDGTLNPQHLQADLKRIPADGIYLRDPECLLFKEWARNDMENAPMGQGFLFTAVAQSQGLPGARINQSRYYISIDPERAGCRHLYDVWARLQAEEVRHGPSPGEPRKEFEGRARPTDAPAWPFGDRWSDPWYDGQNYDATIVDTPNQGTLVGAAGTAADLSDDPVGRIVRQELEFSIFDSPFHVVDLPGQQGITTPQEKTILLADGVANLQPPPTSCLRFARVQLQADLPVLQTGVARQVGSTLWAVIDPEFTEGRPEEILHDHLIVDADTISVWSRRGVAIAEKPRPDGSTPRADLFDGKMRRLSDVACRIDGLLESSDPHHIHQKDVREGENLLRDIAKLKHDFALPQARPMQRFLEASRLDEVLSMVRDVNTAQAMEENIGSIASVQRLIHSVEYLLVAVYSVEWFHALAQGFQLHGLRSAGAHSSSPSARSPCSTGFWKFDPVEPRRSRTPRKSTSDVISCSSA